MCALGSWLPSPLPFPPSLSGSGFSSRALCTECSLGVTSAACLQADQWSPLLTAEAFKQLRCCIRSQLACFCRHSKCIQIMNTTKSDSRIYLKIAPHHVHSVITAELGLRLGLVSVLVCGMATANGL